MSDYRNLSLDQYIKDCGVTPDTNYPESRGRISNAPNTAGEIEDDDKDFVELTDDTVIEAMELDGHAEDGKDGFRTIEQRENVKIASQQWRLQPENVVNKKPEGMPPLVPKRANFYVDLNKLYKNNSNQNNNFNKNRRRRNWNWNNGNGGGGNNGGGINRVQDLRQLVPRGNGNFRNGNNNRGFNNYNQPPSLFSQDVENPIISMIGDLVRNHLDQNLVQMRHNNYRNQSRITEFNAQMVPAPQPATRAIQQMQFNSTKIQTAVPPSTVRSLTTFSTGPRMLNPTGAGIFNPTGSGMLNPTVSNPQSALMNVMPSGELLPTIGNVLLDHIQTIQQNFGNKYDLQTQEEIAKVQNRCMLYRPPVNGMGEGVGTIDGSGIETKFKPEATNVSMNQRFA